MADGELKGRDLETLRAIVRYINLDPFKRPPSTRELAHQLSKVDGAISTSKTSLRQKGLLDASGFPTEKGLVALDSKRTIVSVRLPIAGVVQAGAKNQAELEVEIKSIEQLQDPDIRTLTIPAVADPTNVVVLAVQGVSMEEEHIFEGDSVLVQLFQHGEYPKQGELIIAQYLASKDEPYVNLEDLSAGGHVPDEFLEGPTVKYYYQQEGHYRLSIRKNYAESQFTIRTRYIKPIGKVIGVYRAIS